jgi:hypothetical protein
MPKNNVSDLITDQDRAALQQQLLKQQAEELRRLNLARERVLARLWEIASLGPEATRGSITSQVKALSMIVAIQGLIPDRRAASEIKSGPPPSPPNFYRAAWLRRQEGENIDPEPTPSLAREEDELGPTGPEPTPGSTEDPPPPPNPIPNPLFDPSDSAVANRFGSSEATPAPTQAPGFFAVPDTRVPFSIRRNPSAPAAEQKKRSHCTTSPQRTTSPH